MIMKIYSNNVGKEWVKSHRFSQSLCKRVLKRSKPKNHWFLALVYCCYAGFIFPHFLSSSSESNRLPIPGCPYKEYLYGHPKILTFFSKSNIFNELFSQRNNVKMSPHNGMKHCFHYISKNRMTLSFSIQMQHGSVVKDENNAEFSWR